MSTTTTTTIIPEEIKREFFAFDVTIGKSSVASGIKTAKWQNYKHPENAKFQQKVFWYMWENTDKTKVGIGYKLSYQQNNPYMHKWLDHTGDFEEMVYQFWQENPIAETVHNKVMVTREFGAPVYIAELKDGEVQVTDKLEEAARWCDLDATKVAYHRAVTGYNGLTFEVVAA